MEPLLIVLIFGVAVTGAYTLMRGWRAKPDADESGPGADPAVSTAVSTLVAEQGRNQGY